MDPNRPSTLDCEWTVIGPQSGPKVNQKWTENGPKVDRMWTKSGLKVDQKWNGSGPKVDRKWTESGPKVDQKWTQSRPKMNLWTQMDRYGLKRAKMDSNGPKFSINQGA